MQRRILVVSLVLVLGFFALSQEEGVPLGIIVEPPTGELAVRIWVDKPVYAVGETIRINFELNRPAYVYIWDIMPDGRVHQIFPNAYDPQNFFQTGVHVIPSPGRPYVFRVQPPTGTEWLQIMATTVPIPFFQGYSPEQPFPQLGPDPQSWQRELEAQVLGIVPEPTQRAFDFTSFQIVYGPAPGYGTLQVLTTPAQAKLYVDGVFRGYTPRTLTLTAGTHTVLIRKSGYRDYTTSIYLMPGGTRTLNVTLVPAVVNQPPVALFSYSPPTPRAGDWIQFDASASYDPDGHITNYQWDLDGDGSVDQSGPVAVWTYPAPGVYPTTLWVTDNLGATSSARKTVVVGPVGIPGQPPLAGIPGIYVWGTDRWYITVNGSPTWTTARPYKIELRTDGEFVGVVPEGPAPLGLVPEPTVQGWRVVLEGAVSTDMVTYSFSVRNATTIYFDLRLDMDGDGTVDLSPSLVRLRERMVNPPFSPFVVGTPEGYVGPFVPTIDFRIGSALAYTQNVRIIFWQTTISALEGI